MGSLFLPSRVRPSPALDSSSLIPRSSFFYVVVWSAPVLWGATRTGAEVRAVRRRSKVVRLSDSGVFRSMVDTAVSSSGTSKCVVWQGRCFGEAESKIHVKASPLDALEHAVLAVALSSRCVPCRAGSCFHLLERSITELLCVRASSTCLLPPRLVRQSLSCSSTTHNDGKLANTSATRRNNRQAQGPQRACRERRITSRHG